MATFQPAPTYADPVLIDEQTGKPRFNPIWLRWFLDVAQFISNNGGGTATINHSDTAGLQGGTTNQFYHLTAAEYTLVGLLATGFSGTITTAKLTPAGSNGSMTFTNGVLTAQTAAT